jgi:hypothetical protein
VRPDRCGHPIGEPISYGEQADTGNRNKSCGQRRQWQEPDPDRGAVSASSPPTASRGSPENGRQGLLLDHELRVRPRQLKQRALRRRVAAGVASNLRRRVAPTLISLEDALARSSVMPVDGLEGGLARPAGIVEF